MVNNFDDKQLTQNVTFADLLEIFKVHTQDEVETLKKLDDTTDQIINGVVDSFLKRINLIEYKHSRLEYYLLNIISSTNNIPKDKLTEHYKDWCKKFDEVNKDKLDKIFNKENKEENDSEEKKEEQLEGQESLFDKNNQSN